VIFEERSEPKAAMRLPGFASSDVFQVPPFMSSAAPNKKLRGLSPMPNKSSPFVQISRFNKEAAVKAPGYSLANCGKNTPR
jgi:hypothetical protein